MISSKTFVHVQMNPDAGNPYYLAVIGYLVVIMYIPLSLRHSCYKDVDIISLYVFISCCLTYNCGHIVVQSPTCDGLFIHTYLSICIYMVHYHVPSCPASVRVIVERPSIYT